MTERKPDGGLAEWIETLEAMGGDDDGEMLCLLLELRRFREDKPALIEHLEAAQRERDEAVLLRLEVSGALSSETILREKAEAELKRRDGPEPVAHPELCDNLDRSTGKLCMRISGHYGSCTLTRSEFAESAAAVFPRDPVTRAVSDAVAERTAAVRIALDEESCKRVSDAIANPGQPNARIVRAAGLAAALKRGRSQ